MTVRRRSRGQTIPVGVPSGPGAVPASRWDLLTVLLGGALLQYVWRVQEMFRPLALIQFTALVSVGSIVLFMMDRSPARKLAHLKHPLFRPIVAILILAALSVPFSLHARVSYDFLTKVLVKTVILVGILAASIRDRRDVDRLVRLLALGGAMYVAVGLVMATPGTERMGGTGGRGSYDPNDLGLMAVCTLPACVYLMRGGGRVADRLLGVVAGPLLLFGAMRTGSRGAFVTLVALGAYGLVAMSAVRQSKRLLALVVAGAMVVGLGGAQYWERMGTILAPQEDYNWSGQAQSGRMEIWKRGLRYMADRPVVGVGLNAFFVAEGTSPEARARQQQGMGFKWSAPHNSYVEIGAELGVLGLVAFVSMLGFAYREARRIGRTALAREDRLLGQTFGAFVLAFALGGAFLSQSYSTLLYFSIALLIGFSRVVQRTAYAGAAAPGATAPRGRRVALARYAAATGTSRRAP